MISHPRFETEQAAKFIREGKLVAFPTETVYGLGANALDDKAVAKIYAAKNRPDFNPLITHVTGMEDAFIYGVHDPRAEELMDAFWPGPLTLILPRAKGCKLSLLVSAGLDCIGLRAPKHPLAQALLKRSGVPIAAPSANISGHVSPTMAEHVQEELGDKVAMILDGGPCFVGIESTVLDLTAEPVILRPGSVTKERIESVIGKIGTMAGGEMKSPGMLASHYAPNAALRLNATSAEKAEVMLGFGEVDGEMNLSPSGDLMEAAAHLFLMLRELDKKKVARIAVAPIPSEGLGIAINDRLNRAAAPRS